MAEKFEMKIELKSPPEALWNTIKDLNFVYPKLLPHVYDSIEILEGDGRSAGTIRRVNFKNNVYGKSYRSKIESVDEEKKTVLYRVLDGCLLNMYKMYDDYITVKSLEEEKEEGSAVAKGGSLVVWTCIYEKAIQEAPDASLSENYLIGVFHILDAYTLAKCA